VTDAHRLHGQFSHGTRRQLGEGLGAEQKGNKHKQLTHSCGLMNWIADKTLWMASGVGRSVAAQMCKHKWKKMSKH
jgi:hypothetical protein